MDENSYQILIRNAQDVYHIDFIHLPYNIMEEYVLSFHKSAVKNGML